MTTLRQPPDVVRTAPAHADADHPVPSGLPQHAAPSAGSASPTAHGKSTPAPGTGSPAVACKPPDAPERAELHNEMHARPSARIRLPALVVYVAVLNHGVSRDDEWRHLQRLPGQQGLDPQALAGNFLRLRFGNHTVKWERHSEFTRYAVVQPLPDGAGLGASDPDLLSHLPLPADWLRTLPGETMAAMELALVPGDLSDETQTLELGRRWLGGRPLVASVMGRTAHSWAMTDYFLRDSGFERLLVVARPGVSETHAGRITQRLLEMETYRLMAMRGLPVAKALGPMLSETEHALADITTQLEAGGESDRLLLARLASLASRVEQATAEHAYRFSATAAYHGIVQQRMAELRERAVTGTQTLGDFMNRRLSPAMATVQATASRLASLSGRITRATALLRTRVDIATEAQNQQLLEKLTRGQALQLRLQATVEGLSIAAISYYVVSLLVYVGKAAKAAGLPVNPDLLAGALIPVVLWGVWRTTRRIHQRLHAQEKNFE